MIKRSAIILAILLLPLSLVAQVLPPENADGPGPLPPDARIGSYYSIFPLAGYTSDWGFFGGGFIQRINYHINETPFLSNLKTDVTFSTNGYIVSKLEYERIRMFGLNFRSSIDFVGQRIKRAHYFGIGNNTIFDENLYDDEFYYFENRELYFNYQARKNLSDTNRDSRFDLFGEFTFSRVEGSLFSEQTLFSDENPPGSGTSWVNSVGAGVIYDSRDSEFVTTRGIRYQAGVETSFSFLGSDYSFTELRAELRHFLPVGNSLVLAHKLQAEHQLGSAPFWGLSVIGNETGLRGFHRNRFRGNSSVMNLVELRSWLFSFWDQQIRIGAQAFWDTGRVFSDFDSNGLFDEWKHAIGIGGAISLFNPDLVVRGDVGFSNEAIRIYVGAGYIF